MSLASTRAVTRLAWRTARHHRLRTGLIAALIAVAVGIAVGSAIVVRTGTPSDAERVSREFGAASMKVSLYGYTEGGAAWLDEELVRVTPDAEILAIDRVYASFGEMVAVDLANPVLEGKFAIIEGQPASDGEVALSWHYARRIDHSVGDQWSPSGSDTTYEVAATVVEMDRAGTSFVVLNAGAFRDVLATIEADGEDLYRERRWLVAGDFDDVAATEQIESDWTAVAGTFTDSKLGDSDIGVQARTFWERYSPGSGVGIGGQPSAISTLVSALILAEIALLAAAAYATGIRRRLREIGLLATQGATSRQMRGSVVGEAIVTGLIGGILGCILAVAAALAIRPIIQRTWDPTLTSVSVSIMDLVGPVFVAVAAAAFAAWLPARTAARVSPLAALQGRMPVRQHPRWMVPVSLGLVAAGSFLLLAARASSDGLGQTQAIIGVILVIGGGILIGAPLVTFFGKHSHRLPLAGRVVVRDAARQSVRATAAIAALMVILIAAVSASTAMATNQATQEATGLGGRSGDPRFVIARGAFPDRFADDPRMEQFTSQDEQKLVAIIPGAERFNISELTGTPLLAEYVQGLRSGEGDVWYDRYYCRSGALDEYCYGIQSIYLPPAVGDLAMFDAMGIPAATEDLRAGTPIVLGNRDATVVVDYEGERLETQMHDVDVYPWSMPLLYVPEDWATQRGLMDDTRRTVLFVNDDPLTGDERDTLWSTDANVAIGLSGVGISDSGTMAMIVGGAAIVVAIVIAIVVGLSATESDRDIAVMVAVGAAPSMRRRFLSRQSALYTATAAIIAIPLGLLLMAVATGDTVSVGKLGTWEGGIAIPWTAIAGLLLLIPVVVGIGTGLIVRSLPARPPRRVG